MMLGVLAFGYLSIIMYVFILFAIPYNVLFGQPSIQSIARDTEAALQQYKDEVEIPSILKSLSRMQMVSGNIIK